MIESALNRRIEVAQSVMARLDNGEELSGTLPTVKTLAGLRDDDEMRMITEVLTFGWDHVPPGWGEIDVDGRKGAIAKIGPLLHVKDIDSLTMDSALRAREWERDYLISVSVYEMEQSQPPPEFDRILTKDENNRVLRQSVYHTEVRNSLNRVRAFVYDYASQTWQEGVREKDRIELLGPDYRIVIDSLGALDTEVGAELLAALDALGSENPGSWNLSALGCRTVVLKLGRYLWQAETEDYEGGALLSNRILVLKGEKEKNRLFAFIDFSWKRADSETEKTLLAEALDLVQGIYASGSKGKSGQVRRAHAQSLVVNTFQLVHLLDRATRLVPITAQSP